MAEPITLSSVLLGALATVTVGSGIALQTDNDLISLGVLFKDFCDRQNAEMFNEMTALLHSSMAMNPNNYVSVDSKFLDACKEFLDGLFLANEIDVNANYIGTALGGIPVYPKVVDAGYSYDTALGLWIDLTDSNDYYITSAEEAVANRVGQVYVYFNYRGQYQQSTAYRWTDGTTHADLTHGINISLNWEPNTHRLFIQLINGVYWLYGQITLNGKYLAFQIANVSNYATDVYGLNYGGTYDWNDAFNPPATGEGEDTSVALPIPGDLGDIVGPDVDIWDGDISLPTDGTISVPETDNPAIDIDKDIVIPGSTTVDPDVPVTPNAPIIPPIIPDAPDIEEGGDGSIDEGEKDNLSPTISEVSGGLYYYYIGNDVSDSRIDDVIGHATGVVSLSYTPYTWYTDLNITKLPYDKERFNNLINIADNFSVYRINDVTRPVKKVGGFKAYANDFSVNIGEGKPYNYMNETKLYQYPYSFAYIYDGINNPLEIKYHYLRYYYNDVYIKQTVSDKCTYGIFVKNYKGDNEGNLESMVLTSGNELPCSSSTYAQWYATNRNQIAQNIQNIQNTNAVQNHGNIQQYEISKDSNTVNGIGQLIGALGSVFSLDFGGAVGNVTSAINTQNTMRSQQAQLNTQLALNKVSEQNAIQSALALNNDMRNSPATLVSHGSNVFYGLVNNNKNLLLIRMGLNEDDYFRIGTYFTMFGYKQNKVIDINLRSRKYFNYFKIVSPNIIAPNVPSSHIEKIKEIFKNGVTLWHYNNSSKVLDYFHSDNYEV